MSERDEDLRILSELQHFAFCRRQWALIHLEGAWKDNLRTVEGNLLHERAHDPTLRESRGDVYTVRGVNLRSETLGVSGQCDVLEFRRDPDGITLPDRDGRWRPYPVEYKRGGPKQTDADRLQLCGQALCLEEMLCCEIPAGALFYGETRRREEVVFTPELRQRVRDCLSEMRELAAKGHTPRVKPTKSCNACSLKDICVPKLLRQTSAEEYMNERLAEDA